VWPGLGHVCLRRAAGARRDPGTRAAHGATGVVDGLHAVGPRTARQPDLVLGSVRRIGLHPLAGCIRHALLGLAGAGIAPVTGIGAATLLLTTFVVPAVATGGAIALTALVTLQALDIERGARLIALTRVAALAGHRLAGHLGIVRAAFATVARLSGVLRIILAWRGLATFLGTLLPRVAAFVRFTVLA